jgi:hypothetical protein
MLSRRLPIGINCPEIPRQRGPESGAISRPEHRHLLGLDIPLRDIRANRIGENVLQGFSVPAVHRGVDVMSFSARSVDIDQGCFGAYHWLWIGCVLIIRA